MNVFWQFLGFMLAVSVYNWMKANVPTKPWAAWIAGVTVALCVWPFINILGEVFFERLLHWVW